MQYKTLAHNSYNYNVEQMDHVYKHFKKKLQKKSRIINKKLLKTNED